MLYQAALYRYPHAWMEVNPEDLAGDLCITRIEAEKDQTEFVNALALNYSRDESGIILMFENFQWTAAYQNGKVIEARS